MKPKEVVINLPVALLLTYREFDRVKNPAPRIPFVQYNTVESLINTIAAEGIKEPLELSVYKDTALLTDGNHRLPGYNQLGYSECPVKVVVYETLEDLNEVFYSHTINRMKKIGNSLNVELKNIL